MCMRLHAHHARARALTWAQAQRSTGARTHRQVMLWNGTDGTCVSKLGESLSWAPLALLSIVHRRQRLLVVSTQRTPCEYSESPCE